MEIPESLKVITQYIRRSEELAKDSANPDSKVVAYYCKKYALERAIKLKAPDANSFVMNLLTALEKEKAGLGVTLEQGRGVCEQFAFTVFNRADEEDRAGLTSKATAKLFYSAASFFDILEQFGEILPDVGYVKNT